MKYLFIFVICVLLFSCNGQNNTAINDSLPVDTNALINHDTKNYPDSIQNKIVSNIKFGISEQEFKKLSTIFKKSHEYNKRIHLGNFKFVLLSPSYYQGQLYEVDFDNPFVETEDQFKQTIQDAYDLVTAQYGKPDSTHNGTIYKDDEDLFVWHIGRKHIKITSGYFYNEYQVSIVFTDNEILSLLQADGKKLRDSVTHTAKKDI